MTTLHVVVSQIGGYAREDAPTPHVVGAYTDPAVAESVRRLVGYNGRVMAIEVDAIPKGLRADAAVYGIALPAEA